ncbi:MAG: DNA-3-methyladenine glycosylase II, partial [uncultured Craurococcus sp.]
GPPLLPVLAAAFSRPTPLGAGGACGAGRRRPAPRRDRGGGRAASLAEARARLPRSAARHLRPADQQPSRRGHLAAARRPARRARPRRAPGDGRRDALRRGRPVPPEGGACPLARHRLPRRPARFRGHARHERRGSRRAYRRGEGARPLDGAGPPPLRRAEAGHLPNRRPGAGRKRRAPPRPAGAARAQGARPAGGGLGALAVAGSAAALAPLALRNRPARGGGRL